MMQKMASNIINWSRSYCPTHQNGTSPLAVSFVSVYCRHRSLLRRHSYTIIRSYLPARPSQKLNAMPIIADLLESFESFKVSAHEKEEAALAPAALSRIALYTNGKPSRMKGEEG